MIEIPQDMSKLAAQAVSVVKADAQANVEDIGGWASRLAEDICNVGIPVVLPLPPGYQYHTPVTFLDPATSKTISCRCST